VSESELTARRVRDIDTADLQRHARKAIATCPRLALLIEESHEEH
jgi:hypothetical protein